METEIKKTAKKPRLDIIGADGKHNVLYMLNKVCKVAKANNMEFEKIIMEATSDDYEHFCETLKEYFEVY